MKLLITLLTYIGAPLIFKGVTRWLAKRRGIDTSGWSGGSNPFKPPFKNNESGGEFISAQSPFCPHCGTEKEDSFKSCRNCGKRY